MCDVREVPRGRASTAHVRLDRGDHPGGRPPTGILLPLQPPQGDRVATASELWSRKGLTLDALAGVPPQLRCRGPEDVHLCWRQGSIWRHGSDVVPECL